MKSNYVPRFYQKKAVDNIIDHFEAKRPKPGLVVIPTAGGKSWIIADLIDKMGSPGTIVLQPSVELLEQNYAKFTGSEIGGEASLYSASANSKKVGNVTYATPGSLRGKSHLFQHVELIIIDEAHIGTTPRKTGRRTKRGQISDFIKELPKNVKIVGLTATPIVLQTKGGPYDSYHQLSMITRILPRFWSKIIHVTQVGDLYEHKYLTPLRFTHFDFGMRSVSRRGSDFNLEEVYTNNKSRDVVPFTADLLKEAIRRGKKRILVFSPTVQEAYDLQKLVPEVEIVSSQTKKRVRKDLVKRFKSGDLKVIANYGTLTTGFDAPEIDLIICTRPTQSYSLWYQILGRGMRKAEGKDVCDIVDLSGNYMEFGDPKDLVIRDDRSKKGWAMFVKNKVITGVSLNQENKKDAPKNLSTLKNIITFGKHKGTKWEDVPINYAKYLAKNGDLKSKWAKENMNPYLKALGLI
jgi:DNA repair protein RadD